MIEFGQLLVNGLALGAAYALVALGFALTIQATGAVNFAQGDLVMAGGLLAAAAASRLPLADLDLPGAMLLPLVMALTAALGLLLSAVAVFPLLRRPPTAIFVATIACGIILQNLANGWFGAAPRAAPPLVAGPPLALGPLLLGRQPLAIIATAAVIGGALHLLLTRTQLGRRMRATAQDREMAAAVGIPVTAMIAASFALAAALAGAAGLLLANQQFVTPASGGDLMFKAYVAATMGGWGRLGGAAMGALLIGLFETFVARAVSQPVAEAGLFAVLILLLALRPEGLLGETVRSRA